MYIHKRQDFLDCLNRDREVRRLAVFVHARQHLLAAVDGDKHVEGVVAP